MKNFLSVGFIFILIGIFLIIFSSLQGQKANVKAAGGIFLGPIPIFGFGNDKRLIYFMFIIGIIVYIIFEILRRY